MTLSASVSACQPPMISAGGLVSAERVFPAASRGPRLLQAGDASRDAFDPIFHHCEPFFPRLCFMFHSSHPLERLCKLARDILLEGAHSVIDLPHCRLQLPSNHVSNGLQREPWLLPPSFRRAHIEEAGCLRGAPEARGHAPGRVCFDVHC